MAILAKALEGSELSYLDLSNNALGEKGVRAFSALLKSQSHLKALFFVNNGISSDAAKAIVELLPSGKELKTLHFHNNMSGDLGAKVLAKQLVSEATGLQDFRFSTSRVGYIELAEALKSSHSLRKLDLRDNMFGSKAGLALAGALKNHLFLKELYLSDLSMKNKAVMLLMENLALSSRCIVVLDLGNNGITGEAAEHMSRYLSMMRSLRKLSLQENPIKDKGVTLISEALEKKHDELEELDFTMTGCRDEGAIAAATAVARKMNFKAL